MKRWILLASILSIVLFCSLTILNTERQEEPKPVSLAEFNKRVEDKSKTILVYFHADWCAVCKKMKPIVDKVDTLYGQKLEVLSIDTEKDKEVADYFEINSLPLLFLYNKGTRSWIYVGFIKESDLKKKLNSIITP